MLIITEWYERYEVNKSGRPAKSNEELRATRLEYIRLKVHGHSQGAGYRRLLSVSKARTLEVFGLFCKLLELAGNQTREARGAILNERDQPASMDDISFMLGAPVGRIQRGIADLIKVGWIVDVNCEDGQVSRILAEFSENQRRLYNRTEPNRNETKRNLTKRLADESESGESDEVETRPLSDSVFSQSLSASARLGFGSELRAILKANTQSDWTALTNLQRWLDTRNGGNGHDYNRVLELAKESRSGKVPMAVFFSKMDREFGYRANVERQKRET